MQHLPIATKRAVPGSRDGQRRMYSRFEIEGHEGLFQWLFATGKRKQPIANTVHARYPTKQGYRTACFHRLDVPND